MIRHSLPNDLRGKEKLWTIGGKELDANQLITLMVGILPAAIIGGIIGTFTKNIIPVIIILIISSSISYIIAFVKVFGHDDMSIVQYITLKHKCKNQTHILFNRRLSIQQSNRTGNGNNDGIQNEAITLKNVFKMKG